MTNSTTYTAKVSRRYRTGDQFGRIWKGSKIHRDVEVIASDGSDVPSYLYSSLELLSAAKLLCACLNAGMTFAQADTVEFDWAARCKETVEEILNRKSVVAVRESGK
jgi:hypothetical protein